MDGNLTDPGRVITLPTRRRPTPRASGHQTELKNPSRSECEDDERTQNHREQERDGQGQAALKEQEVHLHALEVLKDEDEDHGQRQDADDQRRPGAAQPSLTLARIGCCRFGALIRLGLRLWRGAHRPDCSPANAKPATNKIPSRPADQMAAEPATTSLALKRL
jgi:hypothetical protein